MKRYDNYKDSGVEWIGEVPGHWEVKRLRYVSSLQSGNNIVSEQIKDNLQFPVYGGNGIRGYYDEYTHDGDYILIGRQGAYCGNIKYASGKFWASEHAVVLTPVVKYSYRFLGEFLRIMNLNQYSVSAAQPGLAVEVIKNLEILFPPPAEQTAIATYLDRKTAELDALIADKKRLLELYEEEKTALINQAVTKGIDSDVKMKDSGLVWLGEVPEHWEVKKLKFIVNEMVSGPFGSSLKKEIYTESGYKVYGQEQVIKGNVDYGEYYISEETYNEMSRYKISSNDILISCVGTFGKILLVPEKFEEGIINPRLIKVTPNVQLIHPDYLNQILKSSIVYEQFDALSRGGTMGVINLDLLKQLILPLPEENEQKAILAHIEAESARIATKQAKTEKLIALLTEYRTALVSEVVTGKVKIV